MLHICKCYTYVTLDNTKRNIIYNYIERLAFVWAIYMERHSRKSLH